MTAGGWFSRFFATRAECAQLVADLQEVIRDRDRWADLAVHLTAENQCQRENLAFVMARADELREALAAALGDVEDGEQFTRPWHAAARKALGEEELYGCRRGV